MGLFKKSFTKAIPDKAEISSKNGEQIARWRDRHGKLKTARVTTGKTGQQRLLMETAEWYGRYRDEHGVLIERSTECRDKQAAEQILQRWIREVERVKAGVLTSAEKETRKHQASSFQQHIEAYLQALEAAGTTIKHRNETRRCLGRLVLDCQIGNLAELECAQLEKWLVRQTQTGMGARARNSYRNAIVAFANWCVSTGRLQSNPLNRLPKADEKSDPRRRRRAMSEDELVRLLQVARERPLAEAMTVRRGKQKGQRIAQVRPEVQSQLRKLGHERELIYKTLVLTGLRKNELKSLRVCQLNLDTEQPFVELYAADEKNREGCYIPLRADLVLEIKNWLQDKLKELQDRAKALGRPVPDKLPPDTPLFQVPNGLHRILDRDLKAAGIAKRDDRGRTLDVHALRTTFGTLLSKAGVSPRTAQAAMRHSDIKLTMGVYTDPRLLDVAGAVAALPSLSPPKSAPVAASKTDLPKGQKTFDPEAQLARQLALLLATKSVNSGQVEASVDKSALGEQKGIIGASFCPDKRKDSLSIPDNESLIRGEPYRTMVIETVGLPLALSLFPKTLVFSGDSVLQLVEPGRYRKGWRVPRNHDSID